MLLGTEGELVLGVFKKWAESDTQQIIDLGLWMIAYTQSGTAGHPRILSRTPAYPGLVTVVVPLEYYMVSLLILMNLCSKPLSYFIVSLYLWYSLLV